MNSGNSTEERCRGVLSDSLNDSEEKSHRTEQREAICFCDFCLTDGI